MTQKEIMTTNSDCVFSLFLRESKAKFDLTCTYTSTVLRDNHDLRRIHVLDHSYN